MSRSGQHSGTRGWSSMGLGLLAALAVGQGGPAQASDYQPGPPPTMCAPMGATALAHGIGLDGSCMSDTDLDPDDQPTPDAPPVVGCLTVIDPCGQASTFCDPNEWEAWVPPTAGRYLIFVMLDDVCVDGPNAECADDDPIVYQFTGEVASEQRCTGCAGGQLDSMHGGLSPQLATATRSLSLDFSLGGATDGEPAGVMYIYEDQPMPAMATPAGLHYDLHRPDVDVIRDPNNNLRQIFAPQLLADIVTTSENGTQYEIRYYDPNMVGEKDGLYPVTEGDEFKKWVIENPTGDPNTYGDLNITEYVKAANQLVARVQYQYDGTIGSRNWTLTTKDGGGTTTLRVEQLTWSDEPNDPQGRLVRGSVRVIKDGSQNELSRVYEQYTQYGWGWRRTMRRDDPNGVNLTTTWTWDDTAIGLVLASEQRPDGSWTRYSSGPGENNTWTVCEIGGWLDQEYDPNLAADDSGVRSVTLTYADGPAYRLAGVIEYAAGNLVRAAEYEHSYTGGTLESTTESRWLDTGGSTVLSTVWGYWNGDQERTDYINYPDGRRDDYDYSDSVTFSAGSLPTTPPTYTTDVDPNYATGHHYREIVHGVLSSGATGLVDYKSTKQTVILDPGGLPVFEETWAYTTSGTWVRIAWTARTYDNQSRLTGVYRNDGTYETTAYTSCCEREVTDSTGVTTVYTPDLLGRMSSIVREAVSTYSGTNAEFAAQAEITTEYDYDTPHQETVTVSDGQQLSQTTVRTFDGANRLTSVTTGSGDGALKTLYEYGATAYDGRKVTVYRDYPTTATQGTPGLRDAITEYYCDGRTKSVTGSTVVGSYYDYASLSNGQTWTLAATGTSVSSPRYEKTYYDLLRRTDHVERPGWTASGSVTLTTTYHYDGTTGQLERVETPGQADTLYVYDDLGSVWRTALDVSDNGTIDLSGTDRVTESETVFEPVGQDLWQVSYSWVYADPNDTPTPAGSRWTRLTGLGSGLIRETMSFDAPGNETTTTTTLDLTNHFLVEETTYPDSTVTARREVHAGRLGWTRSKTWAAATYTYDGLGRQTAVEDGRGNATTTEYDASGRVEWVEDGAGNKTWYTYYGAGEANPGRVKSVRNALTKYTYYAYNDRGQVTQTWGEVPYPTENVYDPNYGERIALRTYRGGDTWDSSTWPGGTADETSWSYDEGTGLLEEKTYADSTAVEYTYTGEGRLYTRQWARNAGDSKITTYTYDAYTGELTDVAYDAAWGMTNLEYTYDRLGRRATVTDAAGTRTFTYDPNSLALATESYDPNGPLGELLITHEYEPNTPVGRFTGLLVGTSGDPDAYYAAGYSYDGPGRLDHVTGPGLPTGGGDSGAWYTYAGGSDLVAKTQFMDSSSNVLGSSLRVYEDERDLLATVQNAWRDDPNTPLDPNDPNNVSAYGYTNNAVGLRTEITYAGVAFGSPGSAIEQTLGYDERNELTSSSRTDGDALARAYTYDPIGNRATATVNVDPNDVETTYDANVLNQYERVDIGTDAKGSQNLSYDADGNLTETFVVGDMNCDGYVNNFDINGYTLAHTNPALYETTYPNCDIMNGDINGDGALDNFDNNLFTALLTSHSDAVYVHYTWDAENRLIAAGPAGTPLAGDRKAEYGYDYLGRRIEKQVWTYQSSSWVQTEHRKFVWSGWLMLLELDGLAEDAVVRKYTWGLDLAGQAGRSTSGRSAPESAGGIGGLLVVSDVDDPNDANDPYGDFVYFYDANGNVGQLMDLSESSAAAAIVASYEYDPYGNLIAQAGDYADENPIRWSTKYWDDETGLGYWGYRYYDPRLGKWINRDQAGECGGANLHAYNRNAPTDRIDPLGNAPLGPGRGCGHCPLAGNPVMVRTSRPEFPCLKLCFHGEPTRCASTGACYCPGDGERCLTIGTPTPGPSPDNPIPNRCVGQLCSHGSAIPCGPQSDCICPGDGQQCSQERCGPYEWFDPATQRCTPVTDPFGPIYGNCCGQSLRCETGGGNAPLPGDPIDGACAQHDQCLADNNDQATCDCELVTTLRGINPPPPSGRSAAPARDMVIAAMCARIFVAGGDCAACHTAPQ